MPNEMLYYHDIVMLDHESHCSIVDFICISQIGVLVIDPLDLQDVTVANPQASQLPSHHQPSLFSMPAFPSTNVRSRPHELNKVVSAAQNTVTAFSETALSTSHSTSRIDLLDTIFDIHIANHEILMSFSQYLHETASQIQSRAYQEDACAEKAKKKAFEHREALKRAVTREEKSVLEQINVGDLVGELEDAGSSCERWRMKFEEIEAVLQELLGDAGWGVSSEFAGMYDRVRAYRGVQQRETGMREHENAESPGDTFLQTYPGSLELLSGNCEDITPHEAHSSFGSNGPHAHQCPTLDAGLLPSEYSDTTIEAESDSSKEEISRSTNSLSPLSDSSYGDIAPSSILNYFQPLRASDQGARNRVRKRTRDAAFLEHVHSGATSSDSRRSQKRPSSGFDRTTVLDAADRVARIKRVIVLQKEMAILERGEVRMSGCCD